MSEKYIQIENYEKRIYIKTNSLDKLTKVDAVIFDCDGVLIDIRESCNKAISETVTYLINELTGYKFPEDVVSKEVIHLFKKSGGFNNDWDLAYTISLCILCRLPQNFQEVFEKKVYTSRLEKDLYKRFFSIKNSIEEEYRAENLDKIVGTLRNELKRFAKKCDVSGIASIEEEIVTIPNFKRSFYINLKKFLSYPGSVGESLITTIFEEIFCGPKLFKEIYKQEARIYKKRGLIENEKVIITPEIFDRLTLLLGKEKFGIASGRPLPLAKYTLKRLLDGFNPNAIVFLEEVEFAESETRKKDGKETNLKKPNPFSLFKSSEGLKPFKQVLYVGDSKEDAVMIKKANKLNSRFLFGGVYNHSDFKKEVLEDFFEAEIDTILPSVNDLPVVLESLKKGGKHCEDI